mmetsp:Transcript_26442/g.69521  ORF Transcript_26442/g.69521 Transcript_26442/m.69521 type:complete len:251 (+) Transcript_26442:1337-2089(+)
MYSGTPSSTTSTRGCIMHDCSCATRHVRQAASNSITACKTEIASSASRTTDDVSPTIGAAFASISLRMDTVRSSEYLRTFSICVASWRDSRFCFCHISSRSLAGAVSTVAPHPLTSVASRMASDKTLESLSSSASMGFMALCSSLATRSPRVFTWADTSTPTALATRSPSTILAVELSASSSRVLSSASSCSRLADLASSCWSMSAMRLSISASSCCCAAAQSMSTSRAAKMAACSLSSLLDWHAVARRS